MDQTTNQISNQIIDVVQVLKPENVLEHQFLQDPSFKKGLQWGKPRNGHPEGQVYKHILEVNHNIDQLDIPGSIRKELRIISFIHDTFKYLEDLSYPRDWSKHHGIYARKFASKYINNKDLLNIIEYHDEAYYIWKVKHFRRAHLVSYEDRLNRLLELMGSNIQLYYLFFKCDTHTGDKTLEPVQWFEKTIKNIEIVHF